MCTGRNKRYWAYVSKALLAPMSEVIPLGQTSIISTFPRRGWVSVTVTATCSKVFTPDCLRSTAVTEKERPKTERVTFKHITVSNLVFCNLKYVKQIGLLMTSLVSHSKGSNTNACAEVTLQPSAFGHIRTHSFLGRSKGYENQQFKVLQSITQGHFLKHCTYSFSS